MVQDEDTMPIEQPIIHPIKEKQFDLVEANAPVVNFKKPFILGLMETPALIRNIALVGQMHCGKTSFVDTLVRETHKFPDSHEFELFWAGARQPKVLRLSYRRAEAWHLDQESSHGVCSVCIQRQVLSSQRYRYPGSCQFQ